MTRIRISLPVLGEGSPVILHMLSMTNPSFLIAPTLESTPGSMTSHEVAKRPQRPTTSNRV
jgi:hypothetical protein